MTKLDRSGKIYFGEGIVFISVGLFMPMISPGFLGDSTALSLILVGAVFLIVGFLPIIIIQSKNNSSSQGHKGKFTVSRYAQ
jgi:hypothetical protein